MVCTGSIYGRTPIRLSVRLFHYSAAAAAGLLLWARRAGDNDRLLQVGALQQRAAANAGTAMLLADVCTRKLKT